MRLFVQSTGAPKDEEAVLTWETAGQLLKDSKSPDRGWGRAWRRGAPFTALSAPSSRQPRRRFRFPSQRLFPRGSSLPVSDSFCLLVFSSPSRVNFQNIPECSFTLDFFLSMFWGEEEGSNSNRVSSRKTKTKTVCFSVR